MAADKFRDILSTFEKLFERPEEFLEVRNDKAEAFRSLTKTLYDYIQQTTDVEELKSKELPSLLIEGFDDEQIWQQLELQNKRASAYFKKCLKELNVNDITFGVKVPETQNPPSKFSAKEINSDSEESTGYDFDGSDSEDSEGEVSRGCSASKSAKAQKEPRKYYSTSVVDDRFFKVLQLEEFLKYEDLKAEKGQPDSHSDESDIDLFADIPSEDEEMDDLDDDDDNEHSQKAQHTKEIMYDDFFDPPEEPMNEPLTEPNFDKSGDEVERSKDRKSDDSGRKKKTVRFSQNVETSRKLQLFGDSDDDDDDMLNRNSQSQNSSSKTAFEKQQEKECKRMKELEQSMLQKKPWQFTGEVAADDRPQDSLLRQQVEFDSNLKPDFVTTDEMTDKIENIIKMAIINKAWCDPVRKTKPLGDAATYKPVAPLDHTKSKESLAEVYENQYRKLNEKEEQKESAQHAEIKKLMRSVELTLSSLFCHAPKPPVPEIKIVHNMPAVTVEEVAPVSVSDATLLAPEEVKSKSGRPIGKSERTETDKKRERRKKKKLQKIKSIQEEERQKKKASTSKKAARKFAKQQALKKISQQKNVTIIQGKKHPGKRSNT